MRRFDAAAGLHVPLLWPASVGRPPACMLVLFAVHAEFRYVALKFQFEGVAAVLHLVAVRVRTCTTHSRAAGCGARSGSRFASPARLRHCIRRGAWQSVGSRISMLPCIYMHGVSSLQWLPSLTACIQAMARM
jgi:hypothetical protein